MGKLVIACLLAVILGGAAMFLAGTRVAPAVAQKGTNLNTSITGATVSQTTGAVTSTAP
jgi:hypothetical protein